MEQAHCLAHQSLPRYVVVAMPIGGNHVLQYQRQWRMRPDTASKDALLIVWTFVRLFLWVDAAAGCRLVPYARP